MICDIFILISFNDAALALAHWARCIGEPVDGGWCGIVFMSTEIASSKPPERPEYLL